MDPTLSLGQLLQSLFSTPAQAGWQERRMAQSAEVQPDMLPPAPAMPPPVSPVQAVKNALASWQEGRMAQAAVPLGMPMPGPPPPLPEAPPQFGPPNEYGPPPPTNQQRLTQATGMQPDLAEPPVVPPVPGVQAGVQTPPALGDSLTPAVVPMPQPQPSTLPQGATPMAAQAPAAAPTTGNPFVDALRGVQVPKPPAAQTVRTPTAPHPTAQAAKAGQLLALLQMLNAGHQRGGQLPNTLGSALGG